MIIPQSYVHVNLKNQQIVKLGVLHFGDKNTNGSWRFLAADHVLLVERREADEWVSKGAFFGETPDFNAEDFNAEDFFTEI